VLQGPPEIYLQHQRFESIFNEQMLKRNFAIDISRVSSVAKEIFNFVLMRVTWGF